MSNKVEVRYRCVACSDVVKLNHVLFGAMFLNGLVDHARGNENCEGDFIALVCEKCQNKPEETAAALETMDSPAGVKASSPMDVANAFEADRYGLPYE